MPCSDVTEVIEVAVDAEDRVTRYRFVKKTCGQGVGMINLLESVFQGQTVDAILALDPAEFLEDHPVPEGPEEFLSLKHLIAVQAALEVLIGRASGGPDDMCAAAEVSIDETGEMVVEARIKVDLITEKIASCGNCKGCGKTKKVKVKPVFA